MKFRAVFLALAVVVLWQGGVWLEQWWNQPKPLVVHPDYEVVLFVTESCSACDRARNQLTQSGVRFVEYDIGTSAEGLAKFDALSGMGVPMLVLADKVLRGYSPRHWGAALAEYTGAAGAVGPVDDPVGQ